jgi:hypothetical protein
VSCGKKGEERRDFRFHSIHFFLIFHQKKNNNTDSIRSAPRVVASADPDATGGGVGAVEALAAEAVFEKGRLTGLRWADLGCDACGGRGTPRCVAPPTPAFSLATAPDGGPQPQRSCAVTDPDCAAAASAAAAAVAEGGGDAAAAEAAAAAAAAECGGLTLYLAAGGSDRDGRPLASGAQVRHLSAPSLTRLFDAIRGTVRRVLEGAGSGYVGDGGGSSSGLEGGLPGEGGA